MPSGRATARLSWIYSSDPSVAPVQVTGDFSFVTALTVGDVYGTGQPDLVLRDGDGSLWIYPDNGSTSGNPWTSRTAAGTGWQYADAILVPSS